MNSCSDDQVIISLGKEVNSLKFTKTTTNCVFHRQDRVKVHVACQAVCDYTFASRQQLSILTSCRKPRISSDDNRSMIFILSFPLAITKMTSNLPPVPADHLPYRRRGESTEIDFVRVLCRKWQKKYKTIIIIIKTRPWHAARSLGTLKPLTLKGEKVFFIYKPLM